MPATLSLSTAGCVIVAVAVLVHPSRSVTVTVYVPALSPLAIFVLLLFGLQEYVYGAVPPPAAALASPLEPPLQLTLSVTAVTEASTVGCVILRVLLAEHPLLSLTVMV